MDDLAELEEVAPIKRRRKVGPSEIATVQHIQEPPRVVIVLKDGNSFVCTRESFDAAQLDVSGYGDD
jgi:hypothetical protein